MSLLVDPFTVATVELRRAQLLRGAVDAKRWADAMDVARFPNSGERRRMQASSEVPIHALRLTETSATDILGYWSAGHVPHQPLRWPERRVLLDWVLWCCLVLLAVVHQIIGA